MAGAKEQAWVTSAVFEKDVESALITCYSLKRVYTSRKVVVIASENLSFNSRQALICGFDFVFYLDEDFNIAHFELNDFAKLYSVLALQSFKICAFVSPYMLAVKNCDEIFSEQIETINIRNMDMNTSVFLFKPSVSLFNILAEGLKILNTDGFINGFTFNNLVCNQLGKVTQLDKKYNVLMENGIPLIGNEDDISIVNLENFPSESDIKGIKEGGVLEALVAEHWLKIRDIDVLPLINQSKKLVIEDYSLSLLKQQNEPIAIVGMSCRYPGSNNLEEFWNLLFESEDGTSSPPPFRWARDKYSKHGVNSKETNAGFLKTRVDEFDAKFFGISPKEAVFMDPQHRLMHELVWEALEDACINPVTLRGTSGSIFMGSWTNDYKDILNQAGIQDFYRKYMGNSIGAATARLSFLLGLTGPSIATESGCSSAMVAVHLACKSLQNGETNLALAGGVNLLLYPFDKDILPMVISPDGRCKTFSEDANGFARAEGCGVLVLKRFSDAMKDGDNIWALIRGSAIAQEGVSQSIGTPTVHCESLAIKTALKNAGIGPDQVSFVETHGTGTIVGDPLEVSAIAKAYHSPKRTTPLILGSVKTNVGHTESCSGITGIMKVVLCMHHEAIPAHKNFTKLNPAIDLEAVPAVLPMERLEWKKSLEAPRMAGVSSFGITGTDAHVILQEKPDMSPSNMLTLDKQAERSFHLLKLSAKTKDALMNILENLKSTFEKIGDSIANIAYSLNTGRADYSHRAVIIADSKENAALCIKRREYLIEELGSQSAEKICFLFTGQGSQYSSMAKILYSCSPVFQIYFDQCLKILNDSYNINLKDVLWRKEDTSGKDINHTIYSQTSIFCVEYALLKLWESWGVKPDFVLGHSLGEFAAAVCAGFLSLEDAILLIAERSKLIDQLPQGKMLVIQADSNVLQCKLKEFAGNDERKLLDIAAINSFSQTVVAGDETVVTEFSKFCTDSNLKNVMLSSSHAFHSKHMDPIITDYRNVAKRVKIRKTLGKKCAYISGLRGEIISPEDIDAEYWVEHTREKVRFFEASRKAVELGCRIFIEIGPQPILSALTMMNVDTNVSCLPSIRKGKDDWETILTSLGKLYLKGIDINWKGLDMFYRRKKVHGLPHYPFKGKRFWPDFIKCDGISLHPLIGSPVPNASHIKLFESRINLETHNYIKDHTVGNTIIFPGAGYLEICLAAGLATIENSSELLGQPKRPMKVENLMIKAPLALEDGKTCQIQTVVELNSSMDNKHNWNDLTVKIFHRQDESISSSTSWLEHAVATFSPLPTAEEQLIDLDVPKFLQTIKYQSGNKITSQFYNKLASLGLNFGPAFQSLETVWYEKDDRNLIAKVKIPENDGHQFSQYIVHPVVLDAMIQAIMMLQTTNANFKTKLRVPIKIGKYLWISSSKSTKSDLYIHVIANDTDINGLPTNSTNAWLIDPDGKALGLMADVELVDTTVKAMESVLEQQTSTMPSLWEEIWHPHLGPSQHRHDLSVCIKEKFYDAEFLNHIEQKCNRFNLTQQKIFTALEELVYLNFVRCLYKCGWGPVLGTTFSKKTLIELLEIKADYSKLLNYMLYILSEEGILENVEPDVWKIKALPPSLNEIEEKLYSSNFMVDLVKDFRATLLFLELGNNYSEILKGKQSALSILFPEENKSSPAKLPSISEFYTEYGDVFDMKYIYTEVMQTQMKHCKRHWKDNKDIFRILEIGAGTGYFTLEYLKFLRDCGVNFEYTFTDISSSFFAAAKKKLEPFLKNVTFKNLNIEEDLVTQGFTPNYYDYVVACDVIHATRDIRETLENVLMLLRTNGSFFLAEQTKKNILITYIFGLLDGFWRYKDINLRPDHCTLSTEKWRETLNVAGFRVLEAFPTLDSYHSFIQSIKPEMEPQPISTHSLQILTSPKYWIFFHQEGNYVSSSLLKRLSEVANRQVIVITMGLNFENSKTKTKWEFKMRPDWEQDFEQLMDSLEVCCNNSNIEGVVYSWSLDTCTSQTSVLKPYFYMVKSMLSRRMSTNIKIICLVSGITPIEDNDFVSYHPSTIIGFTKTLKNERPDIKCRCIDIGTCQTANGVEQVFFELWNTDKNVQVAYGMDNVRYDCKLHSLKEQLSALKLPTGSDRFQLVLPQTKSFEDLQFDTLLPYILDPNEVEIQIKASALNFRDIFNILKPSEYFKNSNAVGFDFAGVIKRVGTKVSKWSVGDRVVGMNVNGTPLPSHVKLNGMDIIKVPEGMSFCEACTLPAVVETSYYCLIDVAKITAQDVVLIHTATGGVGLSAVQICQNIGATIFATAGSQRKRNYLKSLGIKYVFHSRNTQYGDEILKITNGRGVDVVLNSLTSDGFKEATLKACAKNARFVEMSKLSIWKPEDLKKLRPDVQYTIIQLADMELSETRRLLTINLDLLTTKTVKPIPYVRFDAVHIREALGYLQKARHIGKVVCVMPEIKLCNGKTQVYTPMFSEYGTYIITGGLGGIGFAVCQWMIEMGAKHVILAGRKGPSKSMRESIDSLETTKGVKIIPFQLDVSVFHECEYLINVKIDEMGLPPLKGIMHTAGTLQDDLIDNQTWETLSSTFKAKVDGTINLHTLTTNLNLEHFVMFSSLVAICGIPGQSNHSAGNSIEDTMAHYRHSIGLPATTINWGQWGEVGIATEVDLPGIKTLSTLQALKGLEYALKSQRTQTCIFNVDSFAMMQKLVPNISNILDKRIWKNCDGNKAASPLNTNLQSDDFWQRYDSLKTISEKTEMLRDKLRNMLRNILKLDDADGIEDNVKFQEIGVDSLMFVEIKNAVQVLLGNRETINASILKDCNTIGMLSDTIIKIIEGGTAKEDSPPTTDEVNELIKEDCVLPENICTKPGQRKIDINDVSKVLLTGCTGMLGPYVLKELTNMPQIKEVICLTRPIKLITGTERLKNKLQDRDLLSQVDMSKVRCVSGNIAKPNLGMETDIWEELCDNVDAVFHCAANVQHIQHYKKRNVDDDIRAVNIGGLKNLLEFACTGSKLKHVYCGSSLLAVVTVDESGCVSENWPEPNDFDDVTNLAYPVSKFVGDMLMKTAVLERGIPGKVFRFPIIMGDSKTGRFVLEQNHVMLRFLFMLKNGIMPSLPYPYPTLPVDICASTSVKIFFDPNTQNDIFNVSNMTPVVEQEFVHVANKLGYKIDIVEYSEFCERIRESTSEDSPFFMFRELYRNEEDIMSIYSKSQVLQQYILDGASNKEFLASKKIAKILPEFYENRESSMDQIYRDLLFAKNQGWLAKYNL